MKVVQNNFTALGLSVFIVWAPYEADAQLTKLCIDGIADAVVTEDSDVLVYSAAAHKAFPVLFKLDRYTGACDKISMQFLLSPTPEHLSKSFKSNNTIESLIQTLASRQKKREGFGVRLFVQSCILAGSDYSINTLDNIGLVTSFRMIRDNAYRNDNVRFLKVLQSLPPKIKRNLDINVYEEKLAKSEAVFYYHLVKHKDGIVKPLSTPRLSSAENRIEHHFTDHFPFMARFTDWSFLGVEFAPNKKVSAPLTISSIVEPAKDVEKRLNPPLPSITLLTTQKLNDQAKEIPKRHSPPIRSRQSLIPKKPIHNPYKKQKTGDRRTPLEERNSNSSLPPRRESKKYSCGDIKSYLESMPDPRFVKKRFPAKSPRKSESMQAALFKSFFQHKPIQNLTSNTSEFAAFEYAPGEDSDEYAECPNYPCTLRGVNEAVGHTCAQRIEESCSTTGPETSHKPIEAHLQKSPILDLTDSRSCPRSVKELPGSEEASTCRNHQDSDFLDGNATCLEVSPLDSNVGSITSKYFKKKCDPRRVTLDMFQNTVTRFTRPCGLSAGPRDPDEEGPTKIPPRNSEEEDCVDSPDSNHFNYSDGEELDEVIKNVEVEHSYLRYSPFTRSEPGRSSLTTAEEQKEKIKRSSPLISRILRQQQQKFTTEVKKYKQLTLNTDQSEEDFLWNG
jgi:hypothetical protein